MDLMKLQNGSDIRGIAIEGVPGEEVNLTEFEAAQIGAAFTYWLGNKLTKNVFDLKICIGCDPRLSADVLKSGLAKGICYLGSKPSDAGLASSPAMFMSTVMPYFDFDGAIMITASHLPYNRNGFKFYISEGGLDKDDITYILAKAKTMHTMPEHYEMDSVNLMEMYAAHLRMMINNDLGGDLSGMKIIVDAGNGSGGFYATEVLEKLGADISDSIYLEPDGNFPNHEPNPENREAMDAICQAVLEKGADLGIIFDTDVDRSAAVTGDGVPVGRNEIIAMAAAIGAGDHPGGTVVTDSITSNELHDYLENDLGLKHYRYKRGYRNVIGKAMELADGGEDAFLAIETSGHAAFANNYFLDDGAYLATRIVIEAARLKKTGKGIDELISGLKSPAEATELRPEISGDDFAEVSGKILDELPAFVDKMNGRNVRYGEGQPKYRVGLSLEEPNYEGVRVNYRIGRVDDAADVEVVDESACNAYSGWFLMRQSLHEPVLPINIESQEEGGVAMAMPLIRLFLSDYENVSKI